MMSVIAEVKLPADDFALGRFLKVSEAERVELETMVPVGERYVPYLWVYDGDDPGSSLADAEPDHDIVRNLRKLDDFDDRALYALDWRGEEDVLMQGVRDHRAQLLGAVGSGDTWALELRFPSHDALSTFQDHCEQHDLRLDVQRIYNPSKPDAGPWYGLTERQRKALVLAVAEGYYDIPRKASTVDVAEQLEISDQAVTERLRRAIRTLVENTLMPPRED